MRARSAPCVEKKQQKILENCNCENVQINENNSCTSILVHVEAKIIRSYNILHKSGRPVFVYRPSLQEGFLTGLLLRNPGGVGVGIRSNFHDGRSSALMRPDVQPELQPAVQLAQSTRQRRQSTSRCFVHIPGYAWRCCK